MTALTRRQLLVGGVGGVGFLAGLGGGRGGRPRWASAEELEGTAAAPAVVRELETALAQAIARFQAKDLAGILAHVSDDYWTGPFTKKTVRAQLAAMFQTHREVRAPIRIDDVRMVGQHAWVYSTGAMEGLLPLVNRWYALFSWEHELEVARQERGGWRLYGYQN